MITRFGSLFAGHIDLDDMGFDATPANDRSYSNERLATVFDKTDAIARTLDENGYDTFWMAEHHFQKEGYECIPNLMMEAIHLCNITKNISIGCGFNVAPMWHPLRMAEDYAVADIRTKGRVKFGVARGYHTREVEVFGSPMLDGDANRELFEEQVDIIFKAFNSDSFSHKGKYYTIPPSVPYRGYQLEEITLVPRPVNPVECWQPIVSASERGLNFMAKHNMNGIIGGGAAPGGAQESVVRAWQDINAKHGRETELGGKLIISFSVYLAESLEKGISETRKYFEENMKMFAPLGFVRGLTDDQISALADPSRVHSANLPTLEQAIEGGSWLIGTPEQITEKLMSIQEQYPGLEEINIGLPVGSPQSAITEQLEWFAKDVMPAFKSHAHEPALADD